MAEEPHTPKRRKRARQAVLVVVAVLTVLLLIWVWPPHPAPEAIALAKVNQWCLLKEGPSICLPGDQISIHLPRETFDWAATNDFARVAIIESRLCGSNLAIIDTDSGTEVASCTFPRRLRAPSWSADGKVLAARTDKPGVALFELESDTGFLSQTDLDLPEDCDGVTAPAVLSKDHFIVSGAFGEGGQRRPALWDVHVSPKSTKYLADGFMPVAFSETEVICWRTQCLLVNPSTGVQKVLVRPTREYSGWFYVSPDRRFILFGQPGPLYLSTIRTWIAPVDGGKSMCLLDHITTSCRSWSAHATQQRVLNVLNYLRSEGIVPVEVIKSVDGKDVSATYP